MIKVNPTKLILFTIYYWIRDFTHGGGGGGGIGLEKRGFENICEMKSEFKIFLKNLATKNKRQKIKCGN